MNHLTSRVVARSRRRAPAPELTLPDNDNASSTIELNFVLQKRRRRNEHQLRKNESPLPLPCCQLLPSMSKIGKKKSKSRTASVAVSRAASVGDLKVIAAAVFKLHFVSEQLAEDDTTPEPPPIRLTLGCHSAGGLLDEDDDELVIRHFRNGDTLYVTPMAPFIFGGSASVSGQSKADSSSKKKGGSSLQKQKSSKSTTKREKDQSKRLTPKDDQSKKSTATDSQKKKRRKPDTARSFQKRRTSATLHKKVQRRRSSATLSVTRKKRSTASGISMVTRGTISQYDVEGGNSSCTSICLVAASKFLVNFYGRYSSLASIQPCQLDHIVHVGVEAHEEENYCRAVSLDELWGMRAFTRKVDPLERGEPYFGVVTADGFFRGLESALTFASFSQSGVYSDGSGKAASFNKRTRSGTRMRLAVVLTKSSETVLCVTEDATRGGPWYLFDSHGRSGARKKVAYLKRFPSTEDLADALKRKYPALEGSECEVEDDGEGFFQADMCNVFEMNPIVLRLRQVSTSHITCDSTIPADETLRTRSNRSLVDVVKMQENQQAVVPTSVTFSNSCLSRIEETCQKQPTVSALRVTSYHPTVDKEKDTTTTLCRKSERQVSKADVTTGEVNDLSDEELEDQVIQRTPPKVQRTMDHMQDFGKTFSPSDKEEVSEGSTSLVDSSSTNESGNQTDPREAEHTMSAVSDSGSENMKHTDSETSFQSGKVATKPPKRNTMSSFKRKMPSFVSATELMLANEPSSYALPERDVKGHKMEATSPKLGSSRRLTLGKKHSNPVVRLQVEKTFEGKNRNPNDSERNFDESEHERTFSSTVEIDYTMEEEDALRCMETGNIGPRQTELSKQKSKKITIDDHLDSAVCEAKHKRSTRELVLSPTSYSSVSTLSSAQNKDGSSTCSSQSSGRDDFPLFGDGGAAGLVIQALELKSRSLERKKSELMFRHIPVDERRQAARSSALKHVTRKLQATQARIDELRLKEALWMEENETQSQLV